MVQNHKIKSPWLSKNLIKFHAQDRYPVRFNLSKGHFKIKVCSLAPVAVLNWFNDNRANRIKLNIDLI